MIRAMTEADLPALADLMRDSWGDRTAFFRWAISDPEADPLVDVASGRLVATGVGTLNGAVGWVGAIFVREEERRAGLGRAMTEAVVERLESRGARTLALVASSIGRPLYERLGFEERARYVTFEIEGTDEAAVAGRLAVRPFRPELDLASVVRLDALATAEDRAHLLRSFATPESAIVVADAGDDVHGFVVRPPFGGGATVADSTEAGLALLDHRRRVAGPTRRVRAGLPSTNEAGRRALRAAGWREAWSAPRLERGEAIDWRPDWIFGQLAMALG